jgi:hypothetical protein
MMGMLIVHPTDGTESYAFSTATTRDLAQQGFTRFSLNPGATVVVSGVRASQGQKIDGFVAARADSIATADGRRIFDRAKL